MYRRITRIFSEFTKSEKNAGLVLIVCAIFSLLMANSKDGADYIQFWQQHIRFSFSTYQIEYSIKHWIDEGLMSIFFLLVGLEIEREFYDGELHPIKNALLPIFAAIGGMLLPALIYAVINYNTNSSSGFGIPMATDIAFSLAVLSLVSDKVPFSIKIILTSLAIIDDLGSIIVIALFYGGHIEWFYLGGSLGIFLLMLLMNRLRIYRLTIYLIMGLVLWYFMAHSGIHATLSGVLIAFALPFSNRDEQQNPSVRLQEMLHIPVGFIILPLFVLANTAIPIKTEYLNILFNKHALGIGLGLLLGKPLGIFLTTWMITKLGVVKLPENIGWQDIWALGAVAGIGFTMSIFITNLAFADEALVQSSKLMILISSFIAGLVGYTLFVVNNQLKKRRKIEVLPDSE